MFVEGNFFIKGEPPSRFAFNSPVF